MGDIMKAIDALQMERQTQTPQMPKSMPASLAQTVYAGTFKVPVQANMPETSFLTNVGMGFIDATDTFFNDTPEQIRLIGGQAQTALGGYFEEPEMIKRGQMNIATANRNLQANMEQRSLLTPESAQDTFGYALGAGASNYGTMVIGGVTGSAVAKGFGAGAKAAGKAAGAAAIGTMGVMEVGGEAQERAEKHVADTKDESFTEYTPEKAAKNLAAEGAYGAVSMLMEKYMGYGKQRQLFNLDLLKLKSPALRATASLTKTGLKSAVSEAGTEFAQSLANMGIDLIDDTMSWEQVPDRLKQELMGWAAAGVIGGTAGIGAGIYNRSRGIKVIKDNIQGTVPEEDLEKTAAAIFDSAATKVSDVVSVELELSSELQNKHGAVYDSMQRAIKRAADESGAFKNVSEDDLAQYVGDTAKLFADQVLAEAQMRNEPIDTVLKASDIVYEDGAIKLNIRDEAGASGDEQLEQAMYKSPLLDIVSFYNDVLSNPNKKKRYFSHITPDGAAIDIMSDVIAHDKKHNMAADDWQNVLDNISNIENFVVSDKPRFDGQPVLMKIATPDGKYGIVFEHLKNGRNIITTAFKGTDKGIDNWMKKETGKNQSLNVNAADALPSQPVAPETENASSVALASQQSETSDNPISNNTNRSFKDIISSLDENVNNELYQLPQGQIAEKAAFSPTNRDKRTYINDLRAAERGEDTRIRVGELPIVYRELGLSAGMVRTNKDVIFKDTIGKHDVSQTVVDNLPQLFADPIMVFESSTKENRLLAVVNAQDKNGNQIVVAISPNTKGERGYHFIPSFYGKDNFNNFLNKNIIAGNLKYLKSPQALDSHQLWPQVKTLLNSLNKNILQKSDIVNSFMQQKPQPKGLYDASKGVIKIFESADFSTLPHEIAHYWFDNMWSYVRSGNASEKYRQRWNVIANWLNVKPEQAVLTGGQWEKFARGYEQYLLNGDLPTPIIKGAFDDYDRWLKRVYGDMNRLNVHLSEDAVRFFQSMTTGILPPPRIRPSRKPREKMTTAEKLREQLGLQEQDRQEKETVKLVEEMETARLEPDSIDARTVIVSNITEGETGKSRIYSREVERNIDALQEIADIDLDYNKIRLEEQAQRAADFVKNNLEDARKIIDGRKSAPENILDTAIRIAYEQEMLRIGDNAEYLRALKLHSSLQTLRGQEIVAERISTKDIASPTYWINKLVAHRTYKAASKIFKGYAEAVGGDSPVDLYKKMIKNETDQITKKVLAEKTREEQQKVLNAELKRLRYEYGTGVQGELFQMPLEPLNTRNAKMYVREALDDIFGTTVSQEEANQIIGKIGEIEKSIVNTLDETGNPSVQTWQKINEMNNLVESLTPSPALQIATSIVGRGMMLLSIKSPVLNVVSNTENILTEMLIRRAVNSLEGGASFSAVDKNVEKDYLAYADDVYRASGYNVSTTEGLDAATVTLGERRISTQGAGKFRAFARGVETGVFKYLMGYPDSRAKDFVFSDTAALEATTIAQNEGLSGEMLSKRATELYRDATRVAPLTEEGMLIREKAMMEANVATYTNDTAFSKFALGIRETLNKVTGNVRLGDQLMPFVKTPANVVALGVEYSIGAAYLIPNLTTVIRDVKAGKLSVKSRTAIKAAVRNGLGVVLAMLIAMALDPDDYTPDYDALTMSERRLALEKNAVFNSIRIGDKYISLDYFGPLAVPLTAVLSARRRGEVAWFGYAKGVASQLQKLPGLQEFSETVDAIGRATSNKPEKTVKNLNNALIDFIRARTIPSIVNDLAKSIDTYERETSAGTYDKAKASIPGIRESLPLKYTTTSKTPRETEPAWSTVLFGARVKTAASNRVIYEIDRLYKKGAKPTITDVTRSGKLSELSEAKQQRVRKEFAKRYYAEVYTLIRTRAYRAKDDEQKAAAINKVRRQIIEQLKKTYIR